MYGMTITSEQAKVLVDFIDDELATYVEKKVKEIDLSKEGEAFKCYETTHSALMDIKGYALDIVKYASQHSGTMRTPNSYPLPYIKDDTSEDLWHNHST